MHLQYPSQILCEEGSLNNNSNNIHNEYLSFIPPLSPDPQNESETGWGTPSTSSVWGYEYEAVNSGIPVARSRPIEEQIDEEEHRYIQAWPWDRWEVFPTPDNEWSDDSSSSSSHNTWEMELESQNHATDMMIEDALPTSHNSETIAVEED